MMEEAPRQAEERGLSDLVRGIVERELGALRREMLGALPPFRRSEDSGAPSREHHSTVLPAEEARDRARPPPPTRQDSTQWDVVGVAPQPPEEVLRDFGEGDRARKFVGGVASASRKWNRRRE